MQDQGVKFQFRCLDKACCHDWKYGYGGRVMFVGKSCEQYRRAPETKTVPLEPGDVPPGSLIRLDADKNESWCAVVACGPSGVSLVARSVVTGSACLVRFEFDALVRRGSLIKRLGGDWEPCEKVVEVTE